MLMVWEALDVVKLVEIKMAKLSQSAHISGYNILGTVMQEDFPYVGGVVSVRPKFTNHDHIRRASCGVEVNFMNSC